MRTSALAPLLLMAATAATATAASGCTRRPLSPALDASSDGGGGATGSPGPSRGKPFVLGGEHAVVDAVWLPNGHLLGVSERELFDLSPEPPLGSEVPIVPVEPRIVALHGARGAARFVLAHEGFLSLWDATTLHQIKRIEAASDPILSANGNRLAAKLCEPGCAYHVFDTAKGDLLSRMEPASKDDPGHLTLSDDGRFAVTTASRKLSIVDTTNGKVVARRVRTSDTPSGGELVSFRPDRVVLSSQSGVEILGLPGGQVLARIADPFGGEDVGFAVTDDARLVAWHSGRRQRVVVWSTERRPGIPATRTVPIPAASSCNGELAAIEGTDRVHVAGWIVDLKTGAAEPGSTECGDDRFPSKRFERINARSPVALGGTGVTCNVVERATRRIVASHPALCAGNAISGKAPGFRADDRYFATAPEGALQIFDLAAPAPVPKAGAVPAPSPSPLSPGGARVAGIGGLVGKMEHLGVLAVVDGVPAIGGFYGRVFLTKRPPPPAPGPDVPPVGRGGPNGNVVATRTHTFAVKAEQGSRVVTAWDRATSKEVLRETVPPFDDTVAASENVAFVFAGKKWTYLRCEVGKGCGPAPFDGTNIVAFDHPWVLLQAPGQRETSLMNVTTQETRPVMGVAAAMACRSIFREGPTLLCGSGKDAALVTPDGTSTPLTLPATAPSNTTTRGRSGPHIYFDAAVNAGLTPGYRYDVRTRETTELFLGPKLAIARFPDGTIERLGDVAAADDWLRCLDGDRLLPWSACSAAHQVDGKLDATLPATDAR